ncbi:MAG: hypothetical protein AABX01_01705 [Candidatus Micrarchaeota archaeon]
MSETDIWLHFYSSSKNIDIKKLAERVVSALLENGFEFSNITEEFKGLPKMTVAKAIKTLSHEERNGSITIGESVGFVDREDSAIRFGTEMSLGITLWNYEGIYDVHLSFHKSALDALSLRGVKDPKEFDKKLGEYESRGERVLELAKAIWNSLGKNALYGKVDYYWALRLDFPDNIFFERNLSKERVTPDASPKIYWLNFYSPSLVEKIGKEKLFSAPANRAEQLENGFVLMLSKLPHSCDPASPPNFYTQYEEAYKFFGWMHIFIEIGNREDKAEWRDRAYTVAALQDILKVEIGEARMKNPELRIFVRLNYWYAKERPLPEKFEKLRRWLLDEMGAWRVQRNAEFYDDLQLHFYCPSNRISSVEIAKRVSTGLSDANQSPMPSYHLRGYEDVSELTLGQAIRELSTGKTGVWFLDSPDPESSPPSLLHLSINNSPLAPIIQVSLAVYNFPLYDVYNLKYIGDEKERETKLHEYEIRSERLIELAKAIWRSLGKAGFYGTGDQTRFEIGSIDDWDELYKNLSKGEAPPNVHKLFFWLNFYSSSIVEKIGKEKLLSAPAFRVEQLENGILLVPSKLPMLFSANWEEESKVYPKLEKYIGWKHFYINYYWGEDKTELNGHEYDAAALQKVLSREIGAARDENPEVKVIVRFSAGVMPQRPLPEKLEKLRKWLVEEMRAWKVG